VTWAQDVFAGRVPFDPEAENLWRAEVAQIYAHAKRVWKIGRTAEVPCWELPGQTRLENALWHLSYVLQDWVSPRRAAAPSARTKLQLSADESAVIRQQLADLPAGAKTMEVGQ
jgi:hypothetical protein